MKKPAPPSDLPALRLDIVLAALKLVELWHKGDVATLPLARAEDRLERIVERYLRRASDAK